MSAKNRFVLLVFSAFVVISSNVSAGGFSVNQTTVDQSKTSHLIFQDAGASQKESLIKVAGVLELLIKANENTTNILPSFKNNKKRFNPYFLLLTFLFSVTCYAFYCIGRVNKKNTFPLYISYRSLII